MEWIDDSIVDFAMRVQLPHWCIHQGRALLPVSSVESMYNFQSLSSDVEDIISSPDVKSIIMPLHIPGHWLAVQLSCDGWIRTWDSLKIHPARIASKARYIVNMPKTAKAPAAQWASALLRGAEEWQVAQNTCPKQGVGGCGLYCISNCCELLLFGMVASQAKRASDDHLRLEIVQSLERAIVTDKTITETELIRLDSCETDAININMNNSFETEFNTNITTEDTTNTSRHMTIDNSGSIILNISATYVRVMRYSSSYEYPKAANTLRRMHCVVWPDYCLTLNINPTDLVEITETWGGI
jgi:hypothetical protein